jgi:hypothetical protein
MTKLLLTAVVTVVSIPKVTAVIKNWLGAKNWGCIGGLLKGGIGGEIIVILINRGDFSPHSLPYGFLKSKR